MSGNGKLNVLIVEDDLDTCTNLRDILEIDQHEVAVATTAAATLEYPGLSQREVILLDRRLPDGSADELLPRLKSAAPQAEVIIVTGHADLDSAIEALRMGATDYLLKPINPDALRACLLRIAEHRRLVREKALTEYAFQNLVEAAPCMIVILRADHTITYFSAFAEQLTGYAVQEVLGRDYFALFLPEVERSGVEGQMQTILSGQPTRGYENPVRCRDGTQRWMVWNAQRLDDFEGAPAVLAVGQDITEHKRAVEKLVQAERLAAIGEAVTSLTHESRNALQRSQASAEMLARCVEGHPKAQQWLQHIQNAQDDLHQLFEEVREFAAPVKLNLQTCHLGEVLQATWNDLAVVRQNREATLHTDRRLPHLRCQVDQFALRQVFRNLLENSLAACEDPVEITFSAWATESKGNTFLRLSLRDNGPGLEPAVRERIFEPFYTNKTGGTGLGLSICRRFIGAHGGEIAAGNGPGAEFVITLPTSPAGT